MVKTGDRWPGASSNSLWIEGDDDDELETLILNGSSGLSFEDQAWIIST